MCSKPSDNETARRLRPASDPVRTTPGSPCISNARTAPSGVHEPQRRLSCAAPDARAPGSNRETATARIESGTRSGRRASNQKVWVLIRDTLDVVSSVGAGGRWPGHFYGVGNVAVDSKGNLYTGETYEGKRLQKFIFKGLGAGGRS